MQSNDEELIPMRDDLGNITDNPQPWQAVVAYTQNYTDASGRYLPMHLAVLYELGILDGKPEVFYCPAQTQNTQYPIPYNYDWYTNDGSEQWGTYFPPPIAPTTWTFVRTSYNYWTHGKKRGTELHAGKPMVMDNLQHWAVVPHRKSRSAESQPQGVSVLFADGHVNFCIGEDIFSDETWDGRNTHDNAFNDGPGDHKATFEKILRVLQGHQ